MKWKLLVSLLAFAALFATSVKAQDNPKFEVFAGYSYFRDHPTSPVAGPFGLNGGNGEIAYKGAAWLSAVGDFGSYTNFHPVISGSNNTEYPYLFGPRVALHHIGR